MHLAALLELKDGSILERVVLVPRILLRCYTLLAAAHKPADKQFQLYGSAAGVRLLRELYESGNALSLSEFQTKTAIAIFHNKMRHRHRSLIRKKSALQASAMLSIITQILLNFMMKFACYLGLVMKLAAIIVNQMRCPISTIFFA